MPAWAAVNAVAIAGSRRADKRFWQLVVGRADFDQTAFHATTHPEADASIRICLARDGSELTMSGYLEKVSRIAFDDTDLWPAADGASDVTVCDFSGKGPEGTEPPFGVRVI